MIVRQGDVLIIESRRPAAKDLEPLPADPRGVVLAEGESSGHHHSVFGGGGKLFRFRDGRADRLLTIDEDATVRVVGGGSGGVDRHTPIALKPGSYLVRIQRRWDSATARANRVED